jgi:hypothetical protein
MEKRTLNQKIMSVQRSVPGALAHLGVLVLGTALAVRIDVEAAGMPAWGLPWIGVALIAFAIGWWILGWLLPNTPVQGEKNRKPELRDAQLMACGGMYYAGPAETAPESVTASVSTASVQMAPAGKRSKLARV